MCCAALAFGAVMAVSLPVVAQTATTQTAARQFDIPAGALGSALLRFGEQSGLQFSVGSELTRGKKTAGIKGKYTPEDGLRALLGGTGLTFRFTGPRTVVVEPLPDTGEARLLGPLRVEGADNGGKSSGGVNGSTDANATENSGTYGTASTSMVSKISQSVLDTPQTVSVITRQQLSDQNINDLKSAIAQLPGVTTRPSDNNFTNSFYSRGFEIRKFRIDGGAPISSSYFYLPALDMAIYDSIEVLRGADGLYSGYGDPGGVVNLVRKRPLDHPQVLVEAQVASWDNYRTMIDATGPLGFDGSLRGRLVLTYEDKDFFYDTAYDKHTTIYGVLEKDITPDLVVRGGFSVIDEDGLPWQSGLPRYESGESLGLSRETCLCSADAYYKSKNTELFLQGEYQINDDWSLDAKLSSSKQKYDKWHIDGFGAVKPDGSGYAISAWRETDRNPRSKNADVALKGAFELFGRKQNITFGANYADTYALSYDSSAYTYAYQKYYGMIAGIPAADPGTQFYTDVLNFDPNDPNLRPSQKNLFARYDEGMTEYTIYANWNAALTDKLQANIGFRYSYFETHGQSTGYCNPWPLQEDPLHCKIGDWVVDESGTWVWVSRGVVGIGEETSQGRREVRDVDRTFSWPPSWSLIYKLTDNLSVYGSYTDTYVSQASQVDKNFEPLDPVTGFNIEMGSNYLSDSGKLNGKASLYYAKKKGFAVQDFVDEEYNDSHPDSSCCFIGGDEQILTSYGLDLELTGELAPGWLVSANYTYNKNKYEYDTGAYQSTSPTLSFAPEHMLKLWTTYQLSGHGNWMDRLSVGGGVNMQTRGYEMGSICTAYEYVQTDPSTGTPIPSCTTYSDYKFSQGFFSVYSGRVAYRINDTWKVALNINNAFDKIYYARIASPGNDSWYGEPRNFALVFSGKF